MTIRYRFPSQLDYEITSVVLADDWLLLQKAGESRLGKTHPSVLASAIASSIDLSNYALLSGATFTGLIQRSNGMYIQAPGANTTTPVYGFAFDTDSGIGSSSAGRVDIYSNGVQVAKFESGTGGWSKNNWLPWSSATYDLGTSSYKWRNLYLSGNIACNEIGCTYLTATYAYTYNITPRSNNAYDLGSSSYRWNYGYIGVLYIGASSYNTGLAESGSVLYLYSNGTASIYADSGGIGPAVNNGRYCGESGAAWSAVHSYSFVNASDGRKKEEISTSDLGLDFVMSLSPRKYRWKVVEDPPEEPPEESEEPRGMGDPRKQRTPPALKEKIRANALRPHYGFIAQEVETALAGRDFAGLVYDPDSDNYGLCYNQFIPILVKAVQELSDRVNSLEAQHVSVL